METGYNYFQDRVNARAEQIRHEKAYARSRMMAAHLRTALETMDLPAPDMWTLVEDEGRMILPDLAAAIEAQNTSSVRVIAYCPNCGIEARQAYCSDASELDYTLRDLPVLCLECAYQFSDLTPEGVDDELPF